MFPWITKHKFRRKGLLITWDWGYPWESLTREEARAKGLILFKNRWVTAENKKRLIQQLRIFRLVRVAGALLILQAMVILADALLFTVVLTGVDSLLAIPLLAIGLGLWYFKRKAWYPAVGYTVVVACVAPYGLLFDTQTMFSSLSPTWTALLLSLAIAYIILFSYVLLNGITRRIFLN